MPTTRSGRALTAALSDEVAPLSHDPAAAVSKDHNTSGNPPQPTRNRKQTPAKTSKSTLMKPATEKERSADLPEEEAEGDNQYGVEPVEHEMQEETGVQDEQDGKASLKNHKGQNVKAVPQKQAGSEDILQPKLEGSGSLKPSSTAHAPVAETLDEGVNLDVPPTQSAQGHKHVSPFVDSKSIVAYACNGSEFPTIIVREDTERGMYTHYPSSVIKFPVPPVAGEGKPSHQLLLCPRKNKQEFLEAQEKCLEGIPFVLRQDEMHSQKIPVEADYCAIGVSFANDLEDKKSCTVYIEQKIRRNKQSGWKVYWTRLGGFKSQSLAFEPRADGKRNQHGPRNDVINSEKIKILGKRVELLRRARPTIAGETLFAQADLIYISPPPRLPLRGTQKDFTQRKAADYVFFGSGTGKEAGSAIKTEQTTVPQYLPAAVQPAQSIAAESQPVSVTVQNPPIAYRAGFTAQPSTFGATPTMPPMYHQPMSALKPLPAAYTQVFAAPQYAGLPTQGDTPPQAQYDTLPTQFSRLSTSA